MIINVLICFLNINMNDILKFKRILLNIYFGDYGMCTARRQEDNSQMFDQGYQLRVVTAGLLYTQTDSTSRQPQDNLLKSQKISRVGGQALVCKFIQHPKFHQQDKGYTNFYFKRDNYFYPYCQCTSICIVTCLNPGNTWKIRDMLHNMSLFHNLFTVEYFETTYDRNSIKMTVEHFMK